MVQLKPFNPAVAGSVPLRCLANTRKGYGIGAKYQTAWEAWLHTQQHPNRDFPALDIPLYYSFTHTIDGIRKNYGHINVRLSGGRVWSDGKIYSSLTAFEQAFTNVKYVGWGESINDVAVIEYNGGDMGQAQTPTELDIQWKGMMGTETPADVLSNPAYLADRGLAQQTFWNNGGEARFKAAQIPKKECTEDERKFLDLRKKI